MTNTNQSVDNDQTKTQPEFIPEAMLEYIWDSATGIGRQIIAAQAFPSAAVMYTLNADIQKHEGAESLEVGDVAPEDADKHPLYVVIIPMGWSTEGERDAQAEQLRGICRKYDAVACAFISEIYLIEDAKEMQRWAELGKKPSEHPDQVDGVVIRMEIPGRGFLGTTAIKVNEEGVRTFDDIERNETAMGMDRGMFMHVLPSNLHPQDSPRVKVEIPHFATLNDMNSVMMQDEALTEKLSHELWILHTSTIAEAVRVFGMVLPQVAVHVTRKVDTSAYAKLPVILPITRGGYLAMFHPQEYSLGTIQAFCDRWLAFASFYISEVKMRPDSSCPDGYRQGMPGDDGNDLIRGIMVVLELPGKIWMSKAPILTAGGAMSIGELHRHEAPHLIGGVQAILGINRPIAATGMTMN